MKAQVRTSLDVVEGQQVVAVSIPIFEVIKSYVAVSGIRLGSVSASQLERLALGSPIDCSVVRLRRRTSNVRDFGLGNESVVDVQLEAVSLGPRDLEILPSIRFELVGRYAPLTS